MSTVAPEIDLTHNLRYSKSSHSCVSRRRREEMYVFLKIRENVEFLFQLFFSFLIIKVPSKLSVFLSYLFSYLLFKLPNFKHHKSNIKNSIKEQIKLLMIFSCYVLLCQQFQLFKIFMDNEIKKTTKAKVFLWKKKII